MKRTFIAAAVLALAALAPAQIAAGAHLDLPTLNGFAQTGASSPGDLAGRAVLYEFFAFW